MEEVKYKYIKEINPDLFIFGGLIYHHQKIIDPVERDKEFQKKVNEYKKKKAIDNGTYSKTNSKSYFDIEETPVDIDNIFNLKAELVNLKNQQSLSEMAMNKVMHYFGNQESKHPFEYMYDNNIIPSNNLWIKNGIKIIDSDIIIFISHKGLAGNIYNHSIQKQKLCIRYAKDDNLGINIGEVLDSNLVYGFLEYEKYMEQILEMELNKNES